MGDTNTISHFSEPDFTTVLIIWAIFRWDRIELTREHPNPGSAIKSVINWLYAVCKWSPLFLNVRALQLNNLNAASVTDTGYVMQWTALTLESRLYANLMSTTSCIYAAVPGAGCLISLLEGGRAGCGRGIKNWWQRLGRQIVPFEFAHEVVVLGLQPVLCNSASFFQGATILKGLAVASTQKRVGT